MRTKFDALETRQTNFEINLKSSLKTELTREFGTLINEFKREVAGTLEKCQNLAQQMENSITTFEKNLIDREQRMNEQNLKNFRTVAAEFFPQMKTPSETNHNEMIVLRGGGQ